MYSMTPMIQIASPQLGFQEKSRSLSLASIVVFQLLCDLPVKSQSLKAPIVWSLGLRSSFTQDIGLGVAGTAGILGDKRSARVLLETRDASR